jgi:hypothetical protein
VSSDRSREGNWRGSSHRPQARRSLPQVTHGHLFPVALATAPRFYPPHKPGTGFLSARLTGTLHKRHSARALGTPLSAPCCPRIFLAGKHCRWFGTPWFGMPLCQLPMNIRCRMHGSAQQGPEEMVRASDIGRKLLVSSRYEHVKFPGDDRGHSVARRKPPCPGALSANHDAK